MKTIIIGHKNPDTDSIVSAIALAEFCKGSEAMRAGELNNETKFVLNKFGAMVPKLLKKTKGGESFVLVDHNETSQTVDGLKISQVEKIIDHHKAAIETEKPLFMRVEPIGSTASLIAKMRNQAGKKIPAKIAKLLLAGILSDTLNLTSPTTTDEDRKIVKDLNKIAKLDIKKFVQEMFKAKSSLEGISIREIINQDYKEFEMGKNRVGIGVWETTDPESVNVKKKEIFNALVKKKTEDRLDYIFFLAVDIIKQISFMYIVGENEQALAEKVFRGKTQNEILVLENIVSRKKQVVPPLTEALTK